MARLCLLELKCQTSYEHYNNTAFEMLSTIKSTEWGRKLRNKQKGIFTSFWVINRNLLFSSFWVINLKNLFSGDLTVDALIEHHNQFLKSCLVQCLMGPSGAQLSRNIHGALKIILQFCHLYDDFSKTADENSLLRLSGLLKFWFLYNYDVIICHWLSKITS